MKERAKKFQRGLAPYIQEQFAPVMIKDYSEAFEKALVIKKTTPGKTVGAGEPYSPPKRKFDG